MGMVQALKTMAEKKAKDKINKAYEKEKKKICNIYNKLNFIYKYINT